MGGEAARFPRRDRKNVATFSELFRSMGLGHTELERDRTEAKIIQGCEHLVDNTASKVMRKKLIACDTRAKWRDEEVKDVKRVRREAHARYILITTTVGWREYTYDGREAKKRVEKKNKGSTERCDE